IVLTGAEMPEPRTGSGSKPGGKRVVVGVRELLHRRDTELAKLLRRLLADAPQRVDRARTHQRGPLVAGEPDHAASLGERACELRAVLRVAHADGAPEAGLLEGSALDLASERDGVGGLDRHERRIPT